MAEEIKGITVEIGGNTAPLQKALKSVNATTNGLQRELSAVERALKLDPSNTEMLAQKQQLLADAVEAAREKVEALQAAKDRADADMASGTEVNQAQYRLLQREIAFASDKLQKLTSQQSSFQAAATASASAVKEQASATEQAAKRKEELADKLDITDKRLEQEKEALRRDTAGLDENRDKAQLVARTRDSLIRQIGTQKDKISVLREQLDELTRAEGDNQKAIAEKGAELVKAEADLAEYEAKLKDVNDVLKDFGEKAGDVAKKGAAAVGGALVATGTMAAKFTTEYDQALNGFAAATGTAKGDLDAFGQAMQNIYAGNYGEDMADIGQAMSIVAQNAKELDASGIEQMTTQALALRDTFDFDVTESVRAAKMLMDQFGIDGSEAFNLIVQGARQGLDKNGDLLDTINEYAVHFNQLGFTAEDMFNSLSSGAESGTFSVDKLGDAVKEFGIRVKDGTADEVFQKLGLNAAQTKKAFNEGGDAAAEAFAKVNQALFETDDKVQQNTLGVTLYGTMWEDLGAEGVQALSNLNDQFDRTKDSMGELDAIKYDDIGSTLAELGRTLQVEVLLPLGQELVPFLRDLAARMKEIDFAAIGEQLSAAFSWILDHGSTILAVIAAIAAAVGVLKAAFVLMPVIQAIQGVIAAVSAGSTVMSALGAALAAIGGPVTLVIAAIAALTAGFVVLWNTNEGFRNALISAWEAIKTAVSAVGAWLVEFFTVTIPEAWNSVVAFFQSIPTAFGNVMNLAKQAVQKGWNAIVTFFTVSVPAWLNAVGAWFAQLPYKLGYALGLALLKVQEWGRNLLNFVTQTIPQVIQNIVNWFSQLPERIWTFLTSTVQKLVAWGAQMVSTGRQKASETISAVADYFSQLPERIWNFLSEAVQKLIAWGTEMVSTGQAKAQEVVETVSSALQELPGKVASIGGDVVKGIWNGISDMAGWVRKKITGWCGDFVQGFKDALGIHSPSRMFRDEVGKHIPTGIAKGIQKTEKVAIKTMDELSQYLLQEAQSWVEDKKFFNQLSLQEELDFWQDLRQMTEFQGTELHEIDKKIYTAKQSLQEKEKEETEKILNEQKQALEEYTSSLNSRADALRGFAGVFDEISHDNKVSGKDLLKNLQDQVKSFEKWQQALYALELRGADASLLDELREQGPKALDQIIALTKLKDKELAEYSDLFVKKAKLAAEQAAAEMQGLNVPVRLDVLQPARQAFTMLNGMISGNLRQLASGADMLVKQAIASIDAQTLTQVAQNLHTAAQTAVSTGKSSTGTGTGVSASGGGTDTRAASNAVTSQALAQAIGDALVQGLALVGDAIFDAIPKQIELYLDSGRMARASWDAYDAEGQRRRRYYAPTREDIARIAMSVMPKG